MDYIEEYERVKRITRKINLPNNYAIYPASGHDIITLNQIIDFFPTIEEITLIDPCYITEKYSRNEMSLKRAMEIYAIEQINFSENSQKEFDNFFNMSENIRKEKIFELETYFGRHNKKANIRIIPKKYEDYSEERKYGLSFIKVPGQKAEMGKTYEFWKKVKRETENKGVIFSRISHIPNKLEEFSKGFDILLEPEFEKEQKGYFITYAKPLIMMKNITED